MSALYSVSYLSEDVMNYLDFDTAVIPAVISLKVFGIVYTRFAQILSSPFNEKTSMYYFLLFDWYRNAISTLNTNGTV